MSKYNNNNQYTWTKIRPWKKQKTDYRIYFNTLTSLSASPTLTEMLATDSDSSSEHEHATKPETKYIKTNSIPVQIPVQIAIPTSPHTTLNSKIIKKYRFPPSRYTICYLCSSIGAIFLIWVIRFIYSLPEDISTKLLLEIDNIIRFQ